MSKENKGEKTRISVTRNENRITIYPLTVNIINIKESYKLYAKNENLNEMEFIVMYIKIVTKRNG